MMKRPNVIFYFSDQQRWDTVGCYGQKLPVTPHLDQLASEGTRFEYAFTAQPVCGPARAMLQTGKYPTEVGCHTNGIALPLDTKTIANYFDEAGYDTAYVGKWHLASDNKQGVHCERTAVPQERRGGYKNYWMASDVLEFTSHGYNGFVFDKEGNKVEFIGYRPDCITNYAIDYIKHHRTEKPFFMFISHIEPHHQNDRGCYEGPDGSKERFGSYEVPGDLVGEGGDWERNYPDYLGCCNSLDYNLGRLMASLKEHGLDENTVIIYTSDHGSHFMTRNGEYKRSCHEASIRIPMIAYGPGFMGGHVVEDLVSLIDIPTTLLDCGGIAQPADFRGRSLKKVVAGEVAPEEAVFVQISESHVGRAIRTNRWKYAIAANADAWKDADCDTYYEAFLYDLDQDPHEKKNLVLEPSFEPIKEKLRAIIKQKIQEVENMEVKVLPKMVK